MNTNIHITRRVRAAVAAWRPERETVVAVVAVVAACLWFGLRTESPERMPYWVQPSITPTAGEIFEEQGRGEDTPRATVLRFVREFDDDGDHVGLLVAPAQRREILTRRLWYRAAMAADPKRSGRSGGSAWAQWAQRPNDGVGVTMVGDHATVIDVYGGALTGGHASPGDAQTRGPLLRWRAELARTDLGGWQITNIEIPQWCGTDSQCQGAP